MLILAEIALVGTNLPDADFWLIRVHDEKTVGQPTQTFKPEYIGIKVERTDLLLPQFAYYLMMYLWQQGYWTERCHGTTNRKNIHVVDVQRIELQPYGGAK